MGAYKSPNKIYGFDFVFEGEIRFGPEYYRLNLNGELVLNRIFGFEFAWHNKSKYLALQEWLTTDSRKGPITTLTIVDLEKRRFARVSKTNQGFVKPLRFEKDLIIYEKVFLAEGKNIGYEMDVKKIDSWELE